MRTVYLILEDSDIILSGDEQRITVAPSSLSLCCDESLDVERMKWKKFTPYWIGKKYGKYKNGSPVPIEGRRKINLMKKLLNLYWNL